MQPRGDYEDQIIAMQILESKTQIKPKPNTLKSERIGELEC